MGQPQYVGHANAPQSNSALGHISNQNNHNRKLTPSKAGQGLAMRANSALNQNPLIIAQNVGRPYEQHKPKQKINGRSNTIEIGPH